MLRSEGDRLSSSAARQPGWQNFGVRRAAKQGRRVGDCQSAERSRYYPLESLPELPSADRQLLFRAVWPRVSCLVWREDNEILLDLLTDAEILVGIGPHRVAGGNRERRPRKHHLPTSQAGDYVVHLEYGIGRFARSCIEARRRYAPRIFAG